MNSFRAAWARLHKSSAYKRYKEIKEDTQDLRGVAIDVAKFVAFYHLAASYIINFTLCIGPSMMPTLNQDGDVVLIDLFSYKLLGQEYKKGDVVVSICPTNPSKRTFFLIIIM